MKQPIRIVSFAAALLLPFMLGAASAGNAAANQPATSITEANITRLTAGLLGHSQFAHQQLDKALAGAFLDRYLEVLDTDHSMFLQSDVTEFSAHRVTLAQNTRRAGDTRVAHAIFARYLQRLEQRTAFVNEILRTETFEFDAQEVYSLDRKEVPRPLDLAAARDLWRQRVRLEYLQEKLEDNAPEQIVKTLSLRNDRRLNTMRQMTRDTVLEIYLSALAYVYDPHSDYLGHEQLAEFDIAMNLSLFGIGARLQTEEGHCKIVNLLPGGPAARSGLLNPGDRIVAVAQGEDEPVDIVGLPLSYAVKLIRGEKGTPVTLTIIPASAGDDAVRNTVALVRDEIRLEEQRAKSRIIDLPDEQGGTFRIGVIELPSFYANLSAARAQNGGSATTSTSATADVALLLDKLESEDVEGVILDLRRNGGGSLEEAISLTGLFISEGPVVQTRGPGGDVDVAVDSDPSVQYGGPLLVLTSRFSASASEILAGALQDYGRAIIVGDPSTFGKGTVQSVVRLAPIMEQNGLVFAHDPGALTVTIRKFYRPSGASTQLEGVVPDIVLPSPSSTSEVGEAALENPLPWDSIPAADYDHLVMRQFHIDTLRKESARRVASGEDFDYLRAENARLTQRLAARTVSLNEAERRQDIADLEKRRQEFEAAMKTFEGAMPVTYELTVNDARLPGLPSVEDATGLDTQAAADETDAASQSPPRDVVMKEAEKILTDYVSLLAGEAAWRPTQTKTRSARASDR